MAGAVGPAGVNALAAEGFCSGEAACEVAAAAEAFCLGEAACVMVAAIAKAVGTVTVEEAACGLVAAIAKAVGAVMMEEVACEMAAAAVAAVQAAFSEEATLCGVAAAPHLRTSENCTANQAQVCGNAALKLGRQHERTPSPGLDAGVRSRKLQSPSAGMQAAT